MLFYPGNVTAILGKPALLNCRVAGVGNKTVSWLRHEGTHLLTAGRYADILLVIRAFNEISRNFTLFAPCVKFRFIDTSSIVSKFVDTN